MNAIQKVSAALLIIFNILLVSIPLLIIIQWTFIEMKTTEVGAAINFFGLLEKTIYTPEGYVNLSTVPWTLLSKALAFSSDILSILPFVLSLFILKSIFKNYQKNDIFSTSNAIHYKKLGLLFLADAFIIKALSNTLMVLAVTLTNPSGHRCINIHFGAPHLKALFFGVLLIIISWVMLEASRIHDEQQYTI